ncbi:hypothetical protein ACVW0Y_003766 [Pseudomonas sp. TE3786]
MRIAQLKLIIRPQAARLFFTLGHSATSSTSDSVATLSTRKRF